MSISVLMPITQVFHQFCGRVAKMNRNLPALVLLHKGFGKVVGVVARIALGCYSQIDDSLTKSQFTFRTAQPFIGQGSIVSYLHGPWISKSNVFPSHPNNAPG